jgi:hypothetical protein
VVEASIETEGLKYQLCFLVAVFLVQVKQVMKVPINTHINLHYSTLCTAFLLHRSGLFFRTGYNPSGYHKESKVRLICGRSINRDGRPQISAVFLGPSQVGYEGTY